MPSWLEPFEVTATLMEVSSERLMIAYYAQRATEYERVYAKPERQADLRRLQEFVEEKFAAAEVLEIACGTGYWTQFVARTARSVLATDINEEVLAIARAKGLDPAKVTFQKADAYVLRAMLRRFNASLAAFWWSHVPKTRIRDFLRRFHRVLCPGVKVVFIDNVYVASSSTPISRIDEHGDSYQIRHLADGSPHEVLKNFPTEIDLRESLSGLATGPQIQFLQYYWILSYFVADG